MLQAHTELQKNEQDQRVSLLTAGLAGIIAGACGITFLALSDKDIRKKAVKRAQEISNALQKWSIEKLQFLENYKQEFKKTEEVIEDASYKHEEKFHN